MQGVAILIVEDEFLIAADIEQALADAGFEVLLVTDGKRAIAKLEQEKDGICGLVTDIRLGQGIDGWAVARRARQLIFGIPVVYISGDSGPDWLAEGVPESILITKPFTSAQIITAVAHLRNEAGKHSQA